MQQLALTHWTLLFDRWVYGVLDRPTAIYSAGYYNEASFGWQALGSGYTSQYEPTRPTMLASLMEPTLNHTQ